MDGSVLRLDRAVSLRYDYYGGWRNVKLLASGQIRRVRDCCIFRINDMEVFLRANSRLLTFIEDLA